MTDIRVGQRVVVRVPNWRQTRDGWVENPSEHEVEVTAVGEGHIDFKPWWGGMEAMLPKRQVVKVLD